MYVEIFSLKLQTYYSFINIVYIDNSMKQESLKLERLDFSQSPNISLSITADKHMTKFTNKF